MVFNLKRAKRKAERVLCLLLIVFAVLYYSPFSFAAESTEREQICSLLEDMQNSYAKRDIEGYMSVFHPQFEYQSDVGTPHSPGDDISGITRELERESALSAFETFRTMQIDLIADVKISFTEGGAIAKSEYTIVCETFEPGNWTWYARGINVFSLVKQSDEWKIIRWQDCSLTGEELKTITLNTSPDELIDILGNAELKIWLAAMLALEEQTHNESVTAALMKAVKDNQNSDIRARAARLLARANLKEAEISTLKDTLENTRERTDIRVAIIFALAAQKNPTVINSLFKAARDGHPEVRSVATIQLAKFRTEDVLKHIIEALEDSASGVRRAAVEAVLANAPLSNPKLPVLLKKLFLNPNEELPTRKLALQAFVKHANKESRSMPISVLTSGNLPSVLRTQAAHILEDEELMDKPQEIENYLLAIFHNRSEPENLRAAAISALWKYATEKSMGAFTVALNSDSKRLKARACLAVGRIGTRKTPLPATLKPEGEIRAKLKEFALDEAEHIHVRQRAVEALGLLKADEHTPMLKNLLTNETTPANLRGTIVNVLAEWQSKLAFGVLNYVAEDQTQPSWLRKAAASKVNGFNIDSTWNYPKNHNP